MYIKTLLLLLCCTFSYGSSAMHSHPNKYADLRVEEYYALENTLKKRSSEESQKIFEDVKTLLQYLNAKGITQAEIGKRFSNSQTTVSNFLNNKTSAPGLVANVYQYYVADGKSLVEEVNKSPQEKALSFISSCLPSFWTKPVDKTLKAH